MRIRDMLYVLMQKDTWTNIDPSSSKINNGLLRAWRDPIKKTVRIDGYFRASTNLSTSDVLFVLPERYRPSVQFGVPAVFTTSSTPATYYVTVHPNGEIKQSLGSVVREGMFSGTIDLL